MHCDYFPLPQFDFLCYGIYNQVIIRGPSLPLERSLIRIYFWIKCYYSLLWFCCSFVCWFIHSLTVLLYDGVGGSKHACQLHTCESVKSVLSFHCMGLGDEQACTANSFTHYKSFSWLCSFIKKNFLKVYFMWLFCLHVYKCTTCVLGAFGGQKRVSEPPELKLQIIVSCLVGSENHAQILSKSSKCL